MMELSDRDAQVAEATGIEREELERLGFQAEPTHPDIGSDGWAIRATILNKKLEVFKVYPVGDYAVVTGRAAQVKEEGAPHA